MPWCPRGRGKAQEHPRRSVLARVARPSMNAVGVQGMARNYWASSIRSKEGIRGGGGAPFRGWEVGAARRHCPLLQGHMCSRREREREMVPAGNSNRKRPRSLNSSGSARVGVWERRKTLNVVKFEWFRVVFDNQVFMSTRCSIECPSQNKIELWSMSAWVWL